MHARTQTEKLLLSIHQESPGCTSISFGKDKNCIPSSYEALTSNIPLKGSQNINILDLACGDGFLLNLLQKRLNFQGTLNGLDLSPHELEKARQRFSGDNKSPTFINANASSMPFPDAHFHFITCHMAFMLMDHIDLVVNEIYRTLKENGKFIAILNGRLEPEPVVRVFAKTLGTALSNEGKEFIHNLGDNRTKSKEGLEELFEGVRFSDCRVTEVPFEMYCTPTELTEHFSFLYDVFLLSSDGRVKFKQSLTDNFSSIVDNNGKIAFTLWLTKLEVQKI